MSPPLPGQVTPSLCPPQNTWHITRWSVRSVRASETLIPSGFAGGRWSDACLFIALERPKTRKAPRGGPRGLLQELGEGRSTRF